MNRNESIEDILNRDLPSAPVDEMEMALDRISHDLWPDGSASAKVTTTAQTEPVATFKSRPMQPWRQSAAIAAGVLLLVSAVWIAAAWRNAGVDSLARVVDGRVYGAGGTRIRAHEIVRSGAEPTLLELQDGTAIEMRAQAELWFERADSGVRIHLNSGGILVEAAKQRDGHLYVQTKDATVSVVGTIFLVNADAEGSRVSVIEGEVRVRHGDESRTLMPGQQVATTKSMQLPAMTEDLSWSKNFTEYVALLRQSTSLPAVPPSMAAGTIRGIVRHAGQNQGIANAQIQLTPSPGDSRLPVVEAFFSTMPQGTQLTPALLDDLNAVQAAGARPTNQRGGPGPGPAAGMARGSTLTRAMTSDANGRFVFSDVTPGSYSITVRAEGYTGPGSPGVNGRVEVMTSPIIVVENRGTPELAISLERETAIGGRILDPSGNPARKVAVSAYQLKYDARGRATYVATISRSTDDNGAYRLSGLPPGEYWVGATPPEEMFSSTGVSRLTTFFPGVSNPRSAGRITLMDGDEFSGLEFALKATTRVSIAGRVESLLPPAAGQFPLVVENLYLVPAEAENLWDTRFTSLKNVTMDPSNGRFEIRQVPAGSYEVIVPVKDGGGQSLIARTRIDVGDRDLAGINVPLASGVEIQARIRYIGGIPQPGTVLLRMRSLEPFPKPFDDSVVIASPTATQFTSADGNGMYSFRNVPPSRYTFQLAGLPDNVIVDIRESGASVFDDGLRVGSVGPVQVEVSVYLGSEGVAGTVYGIDQKPVPRARVVLAPSQGRRQNPALYRTTMTDASGRFAIPRVAPGEYKVFAWQAPPPRNAYLNSEFLSRYESGGRVVRVAAGLGQDLQVPAILENR